MILSVRPTDFIGTSLNISDQPSLYINSHPNVLEFDLDLQSQQS